MALSSAERFAAYALFLVVALSPLPLGANRAWAWVPLSLVFLLIFLLQASRDVPQPRLAARDLSRLRIAAIAFALTLVWVAVQTSSWVPADWRHPGYEAVDAAGAISLQPERTAQFGMRLLGYAMAFWVAVRVGRDPRVARLGLFAIAFSASALAVFAIGRVLWLGSYGEPFTAGFVNRNSFATYAGLGAVISAGFLLNGFRHAWTSRRLDRREAARRLLGHLTGRGALALVGFFLCMSAVFMTGSRGGLAAVIAGLIVMAGLLLAAYGRRSLRLALAVVGLSLTFVLATAGERVLTRWQATDLESEGRRALFEQTLVAIDDYGALGAGLGAFLEVFRPYKTAELGRATWDLAHNSYLENVLELGWPAAACLYLALGVIVAVCARGVLRRRKDRIFPIIGVAVSALAGLHAGVDFSLQMPAIAAAYAVVMGLAFAQSWSSRES